MFTEEGDLDEHNGRYCVTPDFPNGVYAYFATISDGFVESSGPFEKYKLPQYPYFIGNKFKSKPNHFNFKNEFREHFVFLKPRILGSWIL